MNPQRVATLSASVAAGVALLYLLLWWLVWPLLVTNALPPGLQVMPLSALMALLATLGLAFARRAADPLLTRGVAMILSILAAAVLLEYLLGLAGGLETYLFAEATRTVLGGAHPGRPAPQSALIFLFLGLALWVLASPRKYRYDFADLGIGLALFLSFTVLLGHLYGARALYQPVGGGAVGMSPVETLLLLVISGGALALNPRGVVATLTGPGAASAAKRRILPAIILAPVLLGLLQHSALSYGLLEAPLALALTVTANIVVFIALAESVSRYLVRLEEERTGHFVRRETKAKEEGMTDMLTQLLNRRGWDQAVRQAEDRCQREGLNACVIVIDLDGLKRINDTEGHARGDEFIRRAGTALKLAARREDILARLGGDEFACLSVGCPPEHAGAVLKRLSQSLQKASVPASLGYAMRDLAGSIGGAFLEADEAMYKHKRARKAQDKAQTAA
jgi:diguanylate cyclase (GGDEF)-like protein